jgi:PAS domain-containing protein
MARARGAFEDVLTLDGVERTLSAYRFPVLDETGFPVFFCAIVLDITERKRTELALRESDQHYRTLVEDPADGSTPRRAVVSARSSRVAGTRAS